MPSFATQALTSDGAVGSNTATTPASNTCPLPLPTGRTWCQLSTAMGGGVPDSATIRVRPRLRPPSRGQQQRNVGRISTLRAPANATRVAEEVAAWQCGRRVCSRSTDGVVRRAVHQDTRHQPAADGAAEIESARGDSARPDGACLTRLGFGVWGLGFGVHW